VSVALDPERLRVLGDIITQNRGIRVDGPRLWKAFSVAFPGRPQGAEERRWLLAALRHLEKQGTVRLPPQGGRRWEQRLGVAVPTSVDLVKAHRTSRAGRWRGFPWHPRLAWVSDLRSLSGQQEAFLLRVHEGLVNGWFDDAAPPKYRSLQLTGDEKKLGRLCKTQLFGPGRLDLRMLGCMPEVVPLPWERVGSGNAVLVFENSGPFTLARSVLAQLQESPYGVVAYGGGRGFEASVAYLKSLDFVPESISYVGDLDWPGLQIASAARDAAGKQGLPEIIPASALHRAMLRSSEHLGYPTGWPAKSPAPRRANVESVVSFLSKDIRTRVLGILEAGKRIPEEVLGPEELVHACGAE